MSLRLLSLFLRGAEVMTVFCICVGGGVFVVLSSLLRTCGSRACKSCQSCCFFNPNFPPNSGGSAPFFIFHCIRPKLLCRLFVLCCLLTSEPLRCCRRAARSPLPASLSRQTPTHTHARTTPPSSRARLTQFAACASPRPVPGRRQLITLTERGWL